MRKLLKQWMAAAAAGAWAMVMNHDGRSTIIGSTGVDDARLL